MIATTGFLLLLLTLIIQIVLIFLKKERNIITPFILLAVFLLIMIEIISRSIQIRFIALTNTFEALLFFSAMIALVLALYSLLKKGRVMPFILFTGTLIALILLATASSPLASNTIKPPIPALQSGWLIIHVAFSFIGEAFFAFSFAAALYYFITKKDDKRKELDQLVYKTIGIGYPIFTAGALLFGAIWAQYAWGRFWGWDPKEIFALVTWLVYTLYLHLRLMTKTSVKITMILVILGFLLTLFTFFGVNYLLSGLHSYN